MELVIKIYLVCNFLFQDNMQSCQESVRVRELTKVIRNHFLRDKDKSYSSFEICMTVYVI